MTLCHAVFGFLGHVQEELHELELRAIKVTALKQRDRFDDFLAPTDSELVKRVMHQVHIHAFQVVKHKNLHLHMHMHLHLHMHMHLQIHMHMHMHLHMYTIYQVLQVNECVQGDQTQKRLEYTR